MFIELSTVTTKSLSKWVITNAQSILAWVNCSVVQMEKSSPVNTELHPHITIHSFTTSDTSATLQIILILNSLETRIFTHRQMQFSFF